LAILPTRIEQNCKIFLRSKDNHSKFQVFYKKPAKHSPYRLGTVITWGKYTDRTAHAHIWKSATQVSAYVTDRMAQNLELEMEITFDVGITGR